MDADVGLLSRKSVECRICHDEGEELSMETPCACCGSLKYAHRRCVQRWCNEKGDTVCEICLQQFKPGYTAPRPLFHCGVPLQLRGDWEIPTINEDNNPHFISMVATESFLESSFDERPYLNSGSVICCRIVLLIFVVLLVLPHILSIIITENGDYSFALYMLLMLRTIGILLMIFVMLRLCIIIRHQRWHLQGIDASRTTISDEENEVSQQQPRLHLIHVQ
ncbi:hypothetical protein Nepgr_020859 [Nepenthes gracilis]|uniref:RING-CH-type domain-containing protein n=1 Tax=Nepenthes gracilis TaxID=150966 RepID=A0AAD3XVL6_NEPGR|nr:hypothetical protein Nepgr_020859 [Nepenthes gracilis]